MNYRFILTYKPTDSETTATRTCFPLHGDDLSINIDRAEGEWYYTRNLDGKLVFERDDYDWIMGQAFDGTFTLDIKESHDGGANYYDYFTGTFSRASLEIDQDNRTATLNGLKEGVEDLIKNGKSEEYDLMKIIPDSYAQEVQGKVPPALAMVDYRSTSINNSDIFCGGPSTAGGYKSGIETGWDEYSDITSTPRWNFIGIYVEAKVEMTGTDAWWSGTYCGILTRKVVTINGETYTHPAGNLYKTNNQTNYLHIDASQDSYNGTISLVGVFTQGNIERSIFPIVYTTQNHVFPASFEYTGDYYHPNYKNITIYFHYIRASLLIYFPIISISGILTNVLDTGEYYTGMSAFNNSDGGLQVTITTNTSEQANGHRMVPGTDEYGGTPQYFAPPDDTNDWIPLAEDNWNYGSMWYTIQPSVANGLTDPTKFGSFRWTRCWTIGCCIKYLLNRITDGKVVFNESTDYSQFLYGNPNPVADHEPFQWLVTQKSNVMRPAAGGASRCIVRLDWFLELLHNAFNCYYWFERRNDGRYDFRIEHVEYFRRGGTYTPNTQNDPTLDLTRLKPVRNFLRNGQPAKRYADQTNRYTFDLDNMAEKYTYSWQGDGGGDDFKGNPMYFRAGWIEKGSSDDHQVDNIFADLGWLMLNAGTATESSKNYSGLFIFGGYQPIAVDEWSENKAPTGQTLTLTEVTDSRGEIVFDLWITIPSGQTATMSLNDTTQGTTTHIGTYTGTGAPQRIYASMMVANPVHTYAITINFGANYADVIIHRIHARSGNVFYVPNVRNLLRTDVVNYLQNGVLAWPWLQKEYLHYDIPAAKWTYLKDDYTDGQTIVWETDGTIKMVKKQNLAVVPVPDASTEEAIMDIMGIKTGLGIGIIDSAKINLSSRNAEMTIIYDINPQNN